MTETARTDAPVAYEDAPLTRFHIRVAVAGTGGQFSDGFILGIIGIVLTSASGALGLTPLWIGLLGAATLAGLFLGAVVTGPIADKVGRKHIFGWNMSVFAVLSGLQFFIQEPWQLLVLRLLIGVVLGADYVVSKSLVTELSPRRSRGRLMSLLAVAWAGGYVMAYLVGFLLTDVGGESWRYMLAVSALPAVLTFGFRLGVPESPLWLTRHGRTEEAAAIIRRHLGPGVQPPPEVTSTRQGGMRDLFTAKHRKRTAVGALFYVCQVIPFFALGTFAPQVMKSLGVTSALAAGAAYNVFLLVGAVLGLLFIDRIPRRSFLIGTFFAGAALLTALMAFADVNPVIAVGLFALFALVLAAAVNLEFVYPPELFPTEVRASGVGVAVAASRLGSASSTFLLPIVVDAYGVNVALGGCVAVLAVGGLICWAWAPETSRQSLTEAPDAPAEHPAAQPAH
ncbi:major facilitator transporter [Streptomyces zinciresistens K42]|uniref:Major facilitator transporter n=1 Tax=Streptomyces zinciresistens K42 TaxID=700597 RepID=G2GDB9_9ACTN|nr:MFS transporter [Streptomyces zinciresistens]EGX58518.1 major facilitator transporter [Streptomyces zinciresistens K42]